MLSLWPSTVVECCSNRAAIEEYDVKCRACPSAFVIQNVKNMADFPLLWVSVKSFQLHGPKLLIPTVAAGSGQNAERPKCWTKFWLQFWSARMPNVLNAKSCQVGSECWKPWMPNSAEFGWYRLVMCELWESIRNYFKTAYNQYRELSQNKQSYTYVI